MGRTVWTNTRLKKFKNWIARGSYSTHKGDRHLILTNVKTGTTRVYESPEAAKKAGWVAK